MNRSARNVEQRKTDHGACMPPRKARPCNGGVGGKRARKTGVQNKNKNLHSHVARERAILKEKPKEGEAGKKDVNRAKQRINKHQSAPERHGHMNIVEHDWWVGWLVGGWWDGGLGWWDGGMVGWWDGMVGWWVCE